MKSLRTGLIAGAGLLLAAPALAQTMEERARTAAEAARAKSGDSEALQRNYVTPGLSGQPITTVDSSAGGLGGCPYAKSATGNLATEDLVWMLDGLGIETGVDLAALVDTSVWLAGHLGRPSPSRVVSALGRA